MQKITIIAAILLIALNCFSQNYKDSIHLKLNEFYSQKNLPGFAVAIVNMDGVLYEDAFGYANIETKKPYTTETVQSIASVTKTTIAFSIMKLIEEGKLDLEAAINDYLPYDISNPHFKNAIIKIKHLVNHTSGIVDTENNYDLRGKYFIKQTNITGSKLDAEDLAYIELYKQNKKLSLKKYCKHVFSKKGKWYDKDTFLENKPGTFYQYSNLGAVLMAHIVERVSGKCFNKYVEENLFKELNMQRSTFELNKSVTNLLASSYVTENFISTPIFGGNTYPDGGLMTNCKELSIYFIEMIKGYNNKSNLLNGDSYKLMMSPMLSDDVVLSEDAGRNFKNIGVFWQLTQDGGIMHNGGNPFGGAVYMSFNPETNIGRILMTNCDIRASRETIIAFLSIWKTMDHYAEKF